MKLNRRELMKNVALGVGTAASLAMTGCENRTRLNVLVHGLVGIWDDKTCLRLLIPLIPGHVYGAGEYKEEVMMGVPKMQNSQTKDACTTYTLCNVGNPGGPLPKLSSKDDAVLPYKVPTPTSNSVCHPSADRAHIQVILPYPNWPDPMGRMIRLRKATGDHALFLGGFINTRCVHQIYGFSYDCTNSKPALCYGESTFWYPSKPTPRGGIVNLHIWSTTAFVPLEDHFSHALEAVKGVLGYGEPSLGVNREAKVTIEPPVAGGTVSPEEQFTIFEQRRGRIPERLQKKSADEGDKGDKGNVGIFFIETGECLGPVFASDNVS